MDDQNTNPSKVFVGGLGQGTTTHTLKQFFEQFGAVSVAQVVSEKSTGRSRGFGFCVFEDFASVERCLNGRHTIDGVSCEVRRAVPREELRENAPYDTVEQAGKLFVGGLPEDITEDRLKSYFEKIGAVKQAIIMYDKSCHKPRGFGFVVFEDPMDCRRAAGKHPALATSCIAKKAEPRTAMLSRSKDMGPYGYEMRGGRYGDVGRYPYDTMDGYMSSAGRLPERRGMMGMPGAEPDYAYGYRPNSRDQDFKMRGGFASPSPYGDPRDVYRRPYPEGYSDYYQADTAGYPAVSPYGAGYGPYAAGYGYDSHPNILPSTCQGYGKDSYSTNNRYSRPINGYDSGSQAPYSQIAAGTGLGPQRTAGQYGQAASRDGQATFLAAR